MKLMSRIFPRGTNTPDANRLDTRIDSRSVLVDESRSNSGSTSRVVAIFLSRRNENSRLSAREGASKENHVESSNPTSGKHTDNKAKLSSEDTTHNSTANAGPQRKGTQKANIDDQKENGAKPTEKANSDDLKENGAKPTEKANIDDLKENGAKQTEKANSDDLKENGAKQTEKANSDDLKENGAKPAVENGKSPGNTDKLVSGSQKPSSSTGSLDPEAPKSEGQKSSISTASSDPKVQTNPGDAGKSASNGLTNGTNGTPEAQKDKDKDKNQKADVPKEKGKEKADPNKPAQGKSPAPPPDSKKGKDKSDKEGKNSAPNSVSSPPVIPQDDKDIGPEGDNSEKNNLQTVDKSAQNQASSPEDAKLTEKLDSNENNRSGTNLPPSNSNLEVAPIPDKNSPDKNLSPNPLTPSAKASLNSDVPKISATQSTKNESHSDVVKWLASIFGVLLLLTIIIYVIRLRLRHRRVGKAESPPQSPLLNHTEPISRGFPNKVTYNRDFNNSHNFYPFQEEERLRTMEMNKTYGRVV